MAWMLRNYSTPPGRNDDWATLLEGFGMCASIDEERTLFVKKDVYLAEWNRSLNENNIDFILAIPLPTPAIPRNATGKATFMSASGCFIYNFVRLIPLRYPSFDIDSPIAPFCSSIIQPVACQSRLWTRTSIPFLAISPRVWNTPT